MLRLILFSFLTWCVAVAPAVSAAEFSSEAAQYMDAQYAGGHFMGAVLVARDGKVLFEKGYGMADAEWNISNTPHTKFRLGSITKQFTAVCVLQLAEQGKLNVHDPVSKYYPAAPAAWSKITVHHLLTHTSGIPSYTGLPGFFEKSSRNPLTPVEIVKLTQNMPLEFEPGSKWAYDNTGYILLGVIIEKVSGMTYAEYLRKNVLDPAGLHDTGYDLAATVIRERASGYTGTTANLMNAPFLDMTLPYAAGSLYSTADDLLKWDQALYSGKLLKPESFQQMVTPFLHDYAYGWGVKPQGKHVRYSHNGGINGFNTAISRYPEDRTLVVVLCNINTNLPDKIAADLASLSWHEPLK